MGPHVTRRTMPLNVTRAWRSLSGAQGKKLIHFQRFYPDTGIVVRSGSHLLLEPCSVAVSSMILRV